MREPEIKTPLPTESEEQARLVKTLRNAGLAVFAVPNGGKRGKLQAVQLKREGVSKGIPDLILPGVDPRWRCLAIEMKRQKGGRVEPEQEGWHKVLEACGWKVLVCYGFVDALSQLAGLGLL
jgi:Holliday junction resolvase